MNNSIERSTQSNQLLRTVSQMSFNYSESQNRKSRRAKKCESYIEDKSCTNQEKILQLLYMFYPWLRSESKNITNSHVEELLQNIERMNPNLESIKESNDPTLIPINRNFTEDISETPTLTHRNSDQRSIYICEDLLRIDKAYKVGNFTGTKKELRKRYITALPHINIIYFRHTPHAKEVEAQFKKKYWKSRTTNDRDNKTEWVTMDLRKLIKTLDKMILNATVPIERSEKHRPKLEPLPEISELIIENKEASVETNQTQIETKFPSIENKQQSTNFDLIEYLLLAENRQSLNKITKTLYDIKNLLEPKYSRPINEDELVYDEFIKAFIIGRLKLDINLIKFYNKKPVFEAQELEPFYLKWVLKHNYDYYDKGMSFQMLDYCLKKCPYFQKIYPCIKINDIEDNLFLILPSAYRTIFLACPAPLPDYLHFLGSKKCYNPKYAAIIPLSVLVGNLY